MLHSQPQCSSRKSFLGWAEYSGGVAIAKTSGHLTGIYLNITVPSPGIRMLWIQMASRKQLMLGESILEAAESLIFFKESVEAEKINPVID